MTDALVAPLLTAVALLVWAQAPTQLTTRFTPRRGRLRLSPRSALALDWLPLRRQWFVVVAVPGLVVLVFGPPAAAVIALSLGGGVLFMLRRRSARDAANATGLTEAVAEAAAALAGDLSAGQAPLAALATVAEEQGGPPQNHARRQLAAALDVVVNTGRLGGDVPDALRRGSLAPGAEGLRALAAGWQVAEASGAGLAPVLDQVARGLRQQLAADRAVAVALAGARATARLLAALPLVGLAMGFGLGISPVAFLLETIPGRLCLVLGLSLEALGLAWTDHLAASAMRSGPS